MRRARWRVSIVVAMALLATAALTLLAASRVGPLLALVLALLIGIALGNAASRRLERLRTDALARVRGDGGARMPHSRFAELNALSATLDLLVAEASTRADALRVDRDELALLVNGTSEGIVQVDSRARIIRANPAARLLLGLPDVVRDQPIATLIRNVELRMLLARAAQGQSIPEAEITLDDRRLLVLSRPFTDGDARGTVVAFTDLTRLRRLEEVRREFVANVSHELKTPLTSIRGYVETLLTDELPDETRRQFLEVVHNNAERLHHIVDDLLDLSRLESGGWRPELRAVDVAELARDAWRAVAERAEATPLTFTVTGASLPAVADAGGLRQVLTNLFDNAIRHTPAGGTVTVRVARDEGADGTAWTAIEVQDTGSGIPRDALGRVFERFYRVDPARSRGEGGTGLGLSIVKHLVERMGGDVTAASELGKGTTIRVRLRAAQAPAIARKNAG